MPSEPPGGEPVPDDGSLPPRVLLGAADRPLGFYLHVPYCATRCGYCDFNTYTADELRAFGGAPVRRDTYAQTVVEEIRLARKVLAGDGRRVETVFVGGGTPTLLAAADLGRMLGAIRDEFGLAQGAEVTTEANPESVDPAYLATLRES
jgi:coproporphyrinogen III oxidase-like Fe-S oxidoreductase